MKLVLNTRDVVVLRYLLDHDWQLTQAAADTIDA